MDLNSLYDIAERENVKVYNWKLDDIDGMYMNYNNINAIALNYNRLDTSINEKCTLSEELGNYFMDAVYPASCKDKVLISKQEYRAKKWAYSILIPLKKLKEKISQGFNLYDLAEYFNVDYKYMYDCINFYTEKYGILI